MEEQVLFSTPQSTAAWFREMLSVVAAFEWLTFDVLHSARLALDYFGERTPPGRIRPPLDGQRVAKRTRTSPENLPSFCPLSPRSGAYQP